MRYGLKRREKLDCHQEIEVMRLSVACAVGLNCLLQLKDVRQLDQTDEGATGFTRLHAM